MIFGVDYYPEHWDRCEWEQQADLMVEGGFNTVRVGEFCWKLFEREEGVFDFSLIDESIKVLSDRNIKVILGTPTAAPPKWLVDRYDVLLRDRYGRRREWGSRRECCSNSADYQRLSVRVVTEMAKHFGSNPSVIGWQIDNEFGCHNSTRCYCESCRREFAIWLANKYGSVEALNRSWGTAFWGHEIDSFDEVILPGYNSCENETYANPSHNPSLELDYRRFASDSWVKYQQRQIDCIREYSKAPITHNLMGHFSDIDCYDLAGGLDFVSWDNYPKSQWNSEDDAWNSMAHEIMFGAKNKNYIVMEQQAGPCGWEKVGEVPKPGELRLWTYRSIAHGAEGIMYFRFRTALFGMEQYWYGVLDHDGKPRRRFYELASTGKELMALGEKITSGTKKQEVMIYRDFDDLWSHEIKYHHDGIYYEGLLCSYFRANQKLGITPSVSKNDITKHKIVYFPECGVISDNKLANIKEYVQNGGVAVFTFRSGLRNEYNNIYPLPVPGVLKDMVGVEAVEFDTPTGEIPLNGWTDGKASVWCDVLVPDTAETMLYYSDEHYARRAAVTRNSYGKGYVYYVGTVLDDGTMCKLIEEISIRHGVETFLMPDGVERVEKGGCVFYLNSNNYAVNVKAGGISALSGKEFCGKLDKFGVEVVRL